MIGATVIQRDDFKKVRAKPLGTPVFSTGRSGDALSRPLYELSALTATNDAAAELVRKINSRVYVPVSR